VFLSLPETAAIESLWKITQPLVSDDIGYDSAVAVETSGDLRLVVTPGVSGVPPSSDEVGPEIEQLVFEIYRGPEQHAIQILASKCAVLLRSASSASFASSKKRRGFVLDSRIFASGMS